MSKRIVIDPSGAAFVESTELTPVTGVSTLLRSMTKDLALRLPNITPDSWLVFAQERFTFFKLITELKLHTTWTTAEEEEDGKSLSFIHPSFNEVRSEMAVETSAFTWKVPNDMALLFVATALTAPQSGMKPGQSAFTPSRVLREPERRPGLIAVDTTSGVLYRLPLPNVYEDGTLCAGALEYAPTYPLPSGLGRFGSWELNKWNSDLIRRANGQYKSLIRLNPRTNTTIAPKGGNWRSHCFRISTDRWLPDTVLRSGLEGLITK